MILGDLNCDLINPCKPSKDGRCLMDLLDVCHLKHLVTQPIRMTNATKTLIDLILTNNTRRVLRTGVVDTHICDHSLVYTILRSRCPDLDKEKSIFAALKTLIVINSWRISAPFLFISWKFFMIPLTCCMYLNRYTMTFSITLASEVWSCTRQSSSLHKQSMVRCHTPKKLPLARF